MNLVTVIITCAERRELCEATVRSLLDAGMDSPVLVLDQSQAERRQERQEQNSLAALRMALKVNADLILFLEDDLEINRHLTHNLAVWSPLQRPDFGFGSLYNPTIQEVERCDAEHWFRADPQAVYGSQAFLLSPACAAYCVEHWAEVAGMQDIKMSRLARNAGYPIFYHTPSLVQHVGQLSVWGGHFHWAPDYSATFKA